MQRGAKYQYSAVTADGTTIEFTPPPDGPPAIMLPQDRVFSREYGVRLPGKVSAEFFATVGGPGLHRRGSGIRK